MRVVFISILMWAAISQAQAQFYLQQVVNAERAAAHFELLKKNKVKRVVATSFDADGSLSEDFLLQQQVNASKNTLTTLSKSNYTGSSVMVSTYNEKGKIAQVIDSSSSIINQSYYTYNTAGQLSKLEMISADSVQSYVIREVNLFEYNDKGYPARMTRIKDGKDTTQIVFIALENGKPGSEQWWRNNRKTATWYYYYNEQGQLTDVARDNARAGRILPDYLYEYDEQGRLVQQTTVLSANGGNYRIWRYVYDSRGLKIKEGVFNKQQQLEGSIEYTFQ